MTEPLAKLEYLRNNCAGYMNHINSVFNFFLVFAGLVLNAIVIVFQSDVTGVTCIEKILAVFGALVAIVFLGLDSRTRSIIQHLEESMLGLETEIFGESTAYIKGLPTAKCRIVKHSTLFPMLYILFLVLFITIAVCL